MNGVCFWCGRPAEYDHRVVPQSKDGTNTIPLCVACLGKAVAERMEEHGITPYALGKAAGVGAWITWWFMRGQRGFRIETATKLVEALDRILAKKEEPSKKAPTPTRRAPGRHRRGS
jgi:hypothetical protein